MLANVNDTLVLHDRPTNALGSGTAIYVWLLHNLQRQAWANLWPCGVHLYQNKVAFYVLVINVYRPPSSDAAYDTSLVTCINVVNENKECSIVGDFNDHALGPKPCSNKFLKNMHSLGLKQIVNNPANSHRSQEHRWWRISISYATRPHLSRGNR